MINNGEKHLYSIIKNEISTIFDVGCRSESLFLDFPGEVHYFDPVPPYIEALKAQPTQNKRAFYNTFGLSDEETILSYYPRYESFCNRITSCEVDDSANKVEFMVKRGDNYVKEHNLEEVGFLKLDTEGYEFKVLKGFGDFLHKIKYVQFEYGGTYLDSNTKLADVINYLKEYGFTAFFYLKHDNWQENIFTPIEDYTDHYRYCNIVAVRL